MVICLVGAFMFAANVASAQLADRYYPALVALGGAVAGMGAWQTVFGGDYRANAPGAAPAWKRAGLGMSAVIGLGFGLAWIWANG